MHQYFIKLKNIYIKAKIKKFRPLTSESFYEVKLNFLIDIYPKYVQGFIFGPWSDIIFS